MSFAKSKNDFSKKDMNFFSEFSSAASQQISSAFPIFLLATVAILVFTLIVWIVCGIQVMKKQDQINDIKAEMASAAYQEKLAAKDQSQALVEDLRNYHYVMSSLDSKVAAKSTASVETLTAVVGALPDDTVLIEYIDTDGLVTIKGQSLYRESPYNYLKTLKDKDLFSFVQETITAMDPIEEGYKKETLMFGTMLYTFEFNCTLKGHFTVSWASFVDGTTPAPLTSLRTQSYNAGSDYKIPDIATITADGITYNLKNITINGSAVSAQVLQDAINNKELSGKVSSNLNIELFYEAETDNGGES
ncbi:MAG: hypothetical protein IK020_06910 [Clostridiales bacterium]|nr:hypothetical protein [Clostridiales bacterium]